MQGLDFHITIIGAGVIGLAIAESMSEDACHMLLLEKNDRYGMETSSRNSEVIHAAIHYPGLPLKAALCREGNRLLYEHCEKRKIPFKKIGKLIVSQNPAETEELWKIKRQAEENGVSNLTFLPRSRLKILEPDLQANEVIFSPDSGIVDSHGLMRSFYLQAESQGVTTAFRSEVTAIRPDERGFELEINHGEYHVHTRILVNSAGLHADSVAAMAGMDIIGSEYRLKYGKGDYFFASPPPPIRHLIYPVPDAGHESLGIHATVDLAGRVRFGPDIEYVNRIDYRVDEGKTALFFASARRYLPKLSLDALHPDMSGIRPKLQGPGEPPRDFIIQEESSSGLRGLINLVGIESPGLTCAISIAKYVRELVSSFLRS
ncbi:MAG: NAD(P)/FAD-dependent oxidoreductase [Deltaproteobacteria bacterium]|nr:NAD(P)/FAD-dependent oxidoreductase [Deltaproteobacteria bacterium]